MSVVKPYLPDQAPDIESIPPDSDMRKRLTTYTFSSDRIFEIGWNPNKRQWVVVVHSHDFTETFSEHGEVMVKREKGVPT